MENKVKVLYLLTSPMSVNVFGVSQIKALYEHGFAVYLICGSGHLNSELFEFTTSVRINPYLKRGASPIRDSISIIRLVFYISKIKPTIVIYSTPKASLFGAIV